MNEDYRVVAIRSSRRIRQRFYVTLGFTNGKTFMHSELYRDKHYAVEQAVRLANAIGCGFIDAT